MAQTVETIPVDIAQAAMEAIMGGTSVEDAVWLAAMEVTNPCHDREFGKRYGLAHWGELSPRVRDLWDHCFGREARLPAFLTHDFSEAHRVEGAILRRQER